MHPVVTDHGHQIDVLFHCRDQFLAGHHETAVPDKDDRRAAGPGQAGADGTGHAIAHGARDRAGLAMGLAKAIEAVDPAGKAAAVGQDNGFGRRLALHFVRDQG